MPIIRIGWFLLTFHVGHPRDLSSGFVTRDIGSFHKCTHNGAFVFYVMITFDVQILIGVGWFSVGLHGDTSTVVKIMFGSILLICRVNSSLWYSWILMNVYPHT